MAAIALAGRGTGVATGAASGRVTKKVTGKAIGVGTGSALLGRTQSKPAVYFVADENVTSGHVAHAQTSHVLRGAAGPVDGPW